jgi:phosphoglycerate-specific signal transduction histidine kinase
MKLNISAKLIGGFLIIVVLLVAAAGIGWNGSNRSDAAVGLIVHEQLPEEEEVSGTQSSS